MTHEVQRDVQTTRRSMLAGLGVAGLAGTVAACGTGSGAAYSPPAGNAATGSGEGGTGGGGAGGGAMAGEELGSVGEVPVGGGKVFTAAKVVVTQPTEGKYRAFSAICTHMQCLVDQVADGTIDCPCHGSKYNFRNGQVVAGPAPSPLPREHIKVRHGKIKLA